MRTGPRNGPGDESDVAGHSGGDEDELDADVYRDVVAEWRTAAASWTRQQVPDVGVWLRRVLLGAAVALAVLLVGTALGHLADRLQFTSDEAGVTSGSPQVPGMIALFACWWGTRIGAGKAPSLWGAAAAFRFITAAVLPVAFAVGLSVALAAPSPGALNMWADRLVEGIVGALFAWGLSRWAGAMPALVAMAVNTVVARIAAWVWIGDITSESTWDRQVAILDFVVQGVVYLVAVALAVLVLARQARPWRLFDAVAVGVFPAAATWMLQYLTTTIAHGGWSDGHGYFLLHAVPFGALGAGLAALVGWFLRPKSST